MRLDGRHIEITCIDGQYDAQHIDQRSARIAVPKKTLRSSKQDAVRIAYGNLSRAIMSLCVPGKARVLAGLEIIFTCHLKRARNRLQAGRRSRLFRVAKEGTVIAILIVAFFTGYLHRSAKTTEKLPTAQIITSEKPRPPERIKSQPVTFARASSAISYQGTERSTLKNETIQSMPPSQRLGILPVPSGEHVADVTQQQEFIAADLRHLDHSAYLFVREDGYFPTFQSDARNGEAAEFDLPEPPEAPEAPPPGW